MTMRKVLIVAGGTGGHIFPALAFGEWVEARKMAERVTYLSGSRPLEIEIYRSRNVEPLRLPLTGSPLGSSSPFTIANRCTDLLRAVFLTRKIFREERPDICFLFGGYVSLMPLLWSRLLRVPAVFHEQNARAGKVTRIASRLGVPIASGWRECYGLEKPFTPTGIPVRPFRRIDRQEAARILGVKIGDADTIIGVAGGSLSSAALSALPQKISQTAGRGGRRRLFAVLGDNPGAPVDPSVHFLGRQWDMTPFYSLVDGVICRAGASTLAELAAYDIPALAIPWLQAADGHQEANVRSFAALTSNPVWTEKMEEDGHSLEKAFEKLTTLCEGKRPETPSGASEKNEACEMLWNMARDLMR